MLLMIVVMRWQGATLINEHSTKGILDLEFARTAANADRFITFWDPADVRLNIYLDFLFIIAYCWFFIAAIEKIGNRMGVRWTRTVRSFRSAAIIAGLLDVAENISMLGYLGGVGRDPSLTAAYWFATFKFMTIIVVLLFIIIAYVASRFRDRATD